MTTTTTATSTIGYDDGLSRENGKTETIRDDRPGDRSWLPITNDHLHIYRYKVKSDRKPRGGPQWQNDRNHGDARAERGQRRSSRARRRTVLLLSARAASRDEEFTYATLLRTWPDLTQLFWLSGYTRSRSSGFAIDAENPLEIDLVYKQRSPIWQFWRGEGWTHARRLAPPNVSRVNLSTDVAIYLLYLYIYMHILRCYTYYTRAIVCNTGCSWNAYEVVLVLKHRLRSFFDSPFIF